MSILRFKKTILALICLIVVTGNLSGQSKVIDLWNGKVPGAIRNDKFKQTVDSADNWIKMRFVTNPSLDMYPAPAELMISLPAGLRDKRDNALVVKVKIYRWRGILNIQT